MDLPVALTYISGNLTSNNITLTPRVACVQVYVISISIILQQNDDLI